MVTPESQLNRCLLNLQTWKKVHMQKQKSASNSNGVLNGFHSNVNYNNGYHHDEEHETSSPKRQKTNNCDTKRISDINIDHMDQLNSISNGSSQCMPKHVASKDLIDSQTILTFQSIYDALHWASQGRDPLCGDPTIVSNNNDRDLSIPEHIYDPAHVQILVTGSLHLVGGVLKVIGPEYN